MSTSTLLLAVLGASFCAPAGSSAATITAGNGITARIHGGDELAAYLHEDGGARLLSFPGLGDIELYRGPDDPRFPRRDVTEFRPLSRDAVVRALGEVHALAVDVEVDVFLLPAPPVLTSGSFARRDAILLAPSFGEIDDSAVASVTVHEFGHVLTWVYLDPRPDLWETYMSLRGLDPQRNGPQARHADRAREILAEDLRYLFGGRQANLYGAIENAQLAPPDEVAGLEAFLTAALQGRSAAPSTPVCSAYPNPCNPRTTVEMRLASGGSPQAATGASLAIFDLRGRRVRTVSGGVVSNDRLLLTWDGRDETGDRAPSGRYMYVASWQGLQGRGTVSLVR